MRVLVFQFLKCNPKIINPFVSANSQMLNYIFVSLNSSSDGLNQRRRKSCERSNSVHIIFLLFTWIKSCDVKMNKHERKTVCRKMIKNNSQAWFFHRHHMIPVQTINKSRQTNYFNYSARYCLLPFYQHTWFGNSFTILFYR